MSLAELRVRDGVVRFDIVAFHFLNDLVRFADLFVLYVDDGVDEVLALERAEAVLPAEPRENRAVAQGRLPIEIKLGSPPGFDSVFQLCPIRVKVVPAPLRAKR